MYVKQTNVSTNREVRFESNPELVGYIVGKVHCLIESVNLMEAGKAGSIMLAAEDCRLLNVILFFYEEQLLTVGARIPQIYVPRCDFDLPNEEEIKNQTKKEN